MKGYVSKRNTFKIADLKFLIEKSINNVTKDNWRDAVRHTDKLRSDDAERDVVIDNFVDSFIITLTSSDEDST